MNARARVLILNERLSYDDVRDIPHEGLAVTWVPHEQREQLLTRIADYDAYIPTLRIRVDREVIERAPRLRLVAAPSTGTDHLDLDLLRQRGVTVLTNGGDRELLEQLTTTAELAFGLLLTCARHLPLCFAAAKEGRWERANLAGTQLRGKTLGIVGLGRLGTMMARYGQAFWMRVLACDPAPNFPAGVEKVDLPTLLRRSDFVSLHVHLTDQTRRMLDAEHLGMMKSGSCLINTSRGALLDEAALIREMQTGRIAAAGLDVIDGEWLEHKRDHSLLAYSRENPRLYISPHVGGTSRDAQRLAWRHAFEKVVAFFRAPPVADAT